MIDGDYYIIYDVDKDITIFDNGSQVDNNQLQILCTEKISHFIFWLQQHTCHIIEEGLEHPVETSAR